MDLEETPEEGVALSFDDSVVRRMLPHRFPMLLVDRVRSYRPQQRRLVGLKNVAQCDPLLGGSGSGATVFPAVLVLEALAQVSGLLMNLEHVAGLGVDVRRLGEPSYLSSVQDPPLSVLGETKFRQAEAVFAGEALELRTRVVLQRGTMSYFAAQAFAGATEVLTAEILLAYPDYTARGKGR